MDGSCRGVLAALVVVAGLAEGLHSTVDLYRLITHLKHGVSFSLWIQLPNHRRTQERHGAGRPGGPLQLHRLEGLEPHHVGSERHGGPERHAHGVIITSNRFTSENYTEGDDFTSEMIIHDVQLSDAGHIKCSLQNSGREGSAFLSVQVVGKLLVPTDSLVVIEDEPCNVTCRAVGWIPLPELSWEIGVPVSDSSFHSVLVPDDPASVLSILALTPRGSGNLTCVAEMKGLHARDLAP
ncbi:hypothetical protein QTO34_014894 [Cnephaeus nilssonii]|uniref:Ig-like domain-containing protein n=1 Tax=Cnephaeus nilssonii TaxID=3371016 RepID=A0AA40LUG9_CNENI|nr:hypothetical protein QTO34_014894 [Eptesicus nilssonii]